MVILLNILIALYNSAYEDITDNAIDEYMALVSFSSLDIRHESITNSQFSAKTIQFVRAPDENVFIARKYHLPLASQISWLAKSWKPSTQPFLNIRLIHRSSIQPHRALLSHHPLRMVDAAPPLPATERLRYGRHLLPAPAHHRLPRDSRSPQGLA